MHFKFAFKILHEFLIFPFSNFFSFINKKFYSTAKNLFILSKLSAFQSSVRAMIPSLISIPGGFMFVLVQVLPAAKVGWYVAAEVGLEHSFAVSVTKGDANPTRLL